MGFFFNFYILILDSNGAASADLLSKNYRSRVPPSKILIFADGWKRGGTNTWLGVSVFTWGMYQ